MTTEQNYRDCWLCNATGEIKCRLVNHGVTEHDCTNCRGKGYVVVCEDCQGHGLVSVRTEPFGNYSNPDVATTSEVSCTRCSGVGAHAEDDNEDE